ncbi:hypothetical protein HK097_005001 [Rhizophlyctis rosea]|uniref:Uncharacterized protein n=1 Tax=Rhizophlyctis rosea TaxID=64517 RepID=A0AAD5S858_9FUNG|nr:hypothetical protein HK097_005001 [Rhizophlyctis rosea]
MLDFFDSSPPAQYQKPAGADTKHVHELTIYEHYQWYLFWKDLAAKNYDMSGLLCLSQRGYRSFRYLYGNVFQFLKCCVELYSMLLEHVMKADCDPSHHTPDTDLKLVDREVRLGNADWRLLCKVRAERNNLHHARERVHYLDESCFRCLVNIVGRFQGFLGRKLREERDGRM